MRQHRAESLLGLKAPFTTDEVNAAFKTAVKKHHPDVQGEAVNTEAITDLKTARDLLLKLAGAGVGSKCDECFGRGLVPARGSFHQLPCQSCRGTGTK